MWISVLLGGVLCVTALSLLWVAYLVLSYHRNKHLFPGLPRHVQFCHGDGTLALILKSYLPASLLKHLIPYDRDGWFQLRPSLFAKYNTPVLYAASYNLSQIYVNDAEMVRDMLLTHKNTFPKAPRFYRTLKHFGDHLVTAEGETWRRHRAVSKPAFSEKNNRLVFESSLQLANDLFALWERNGCVNSTSPDQLICGLDDLMNFALGVICRAGFGIDIDPFKREGPKPKYNPPPGVTMSFSSAILGVTGGTVSKLIVSKPTRWFAKRFAKPLNPDKAVHMAQKILGVSGPWKQRMSELRFVEESYEAFEKYIIRVMGDNPQDNVPIAERADLTSHLLQAQDTKDGKVAKLTLQEAVANAWALIFAGHETTAHTLAFALCYLALYPDVQAKLQKQVDEVLQGRAPTYADIPTLTYPFYIFYETLRLRPPAPNPQRITTQEVTIGGHTFPKDTYVTVDIWAAHRNTKYWGNDVDVFRPERFDPTLPGSIPLETLRYCFLPFIIGKRACAGRRFAEVEGITFLTAVAQRYTIHLPAHMETMDRNRVLEELVKPRLSFTILPRAGARLRVVRR